MKFLSTAIALAISNFAYQAISGRHEYAKAAERTYFQGVAIAITYWITQ